MKESNRAFRTRFKGIIAIFVAFIMIFGFSLGASAQTTDSLVLLQMKYIVKNYYVDKIPDSSLDSAKSINDVIKLLNDPYSQYFSGTEFDDFINSINNTFVGIGIVVEIVPEGVKVTSVMDNSPAKDASIKVGDIITEADGVKLAGLSSDKAVSYIQGTEGTTVHIKLLRSGSVIELDVVRKQISSPTVGSEVLNNHVGYIEVSSFGDNTSGEFEKALTSLENSKVDSYIVDLRDNPGGYLDTALDMAGYFIGDNPALVTWDRIDGRVIHNAYKHSIVIDKPVIFLINEYSASASEILSGAVKDYGKVLFIGHKTYGKGKAQNMFTLADGGIFKITTERFYSPKGNIIDKVGIAPDVYTPNNVDPLKTALLLLEKAPAKVDKSGYGLVKIANKQYVINMNKINEPGYRDVSANLLSNLPEGSLYIGTKVGWKKVSVKGTVSQYLLPGRKIPGAYYYSIFNKGFSSKFAKDSYNVATP